MGFIDELKSIFFDNEEKGNNNNYLRNIIILGMIGILFLLFGNVFRGTNSTAPTVTERDTEVKHNPVTYNNYAKELASELEEIISLVKGVGRVRVQVYIKNSMEYEYEYNQNSTNKVTRETDQNGGERRIEEDTIESEMVILRDASGNESPVIKKKKIPTISGVLIVAQGAENSKIKYEIYQAVCSFLNLPPHRISILPYEGR